MKSEKPTVVEEPIPSGKGRNHESASLKRYECTRHRFIHTALRAGASVGDAYTAWYASDEYRDSSVGPSHLKLRYI